MSCPSLLQLKQHPPLPSVHLFCTKWVKLHVAGFCLLGMVENLAPAAHVQLSALGGESDSPKSHHCVVQKADLWDGDLGSGRINPPIFPFPVV